MIDIPAQRLERGLTTACVRFQERLEPVYRPVAREGMGLQFVEA